MRSGLWVSGAGGSGIIVGRTEDGSWSPPSGIMLHTAGLGFLVGVDIYDCVVVINTRQALEAFSKVRCTLGGEVSAVAGPVGVGGVFESEVHKRHAPIFTYMKSRGFYAGVQIDGTVVIERTDENERFYGEAIGVGDILAGKVQHPPPELRTLMETIRAAQGDTDLDESLLTTEAPPGDFEIDDEGHKFGVPDKLDPDPYGVLALEKQGFRIVEAGTGKRPTSEAFEFNPSPASPIFSTFSRKSIDRGSFRDSKAMSRRSSWRTSTMSSMTDRGTQTCDAGVQADFDSFVITNSPRMSESLSRSPMAEIPENDVAPTPPSPKSRLSSAAASMRSKIEEIKETEKENEKQKEVEAEEAAMVEEKKEKEEETRDSEEKEAGDIQVGPAVDKDDKLLKAAQPETEGDNEKSAEGLRVQRPPMSRFSTYDSDRAVEESEAGLSAQRPTMSRLSTYDSENAIVEEPIVHQVRQAATPQVIRARLVTVKKPTPPRIPPRNPVRNRKGPLIINAEPYNENTSRDSISPRSPHSSSEHPSVSTLDSASTTSSRDSFSSDDGMDAMNKRISVIRAIDSDETEDKQEKQESSDEFHSVPATPGQLA